MSYTLVREVLEKYGVKGTTFDVLMEKTNLPKSSLYQIIGRGFKLGSIEMYEQDGKKLYRNRLKREKLYGKNEWNILKGIN